MLGLAWIKVPSIVYGAHTATTLVRWLLSFRLERAVNYIMKLSLISSITGPNFDRVRSLFLGVSSKSEACGHLSPISDCASCTSVESRSREKFVQLFQLENRLMKLIVN